MQTPAIESSNDSASVLLRTTATVSLVAYVLGVMILPGARGRLGQNGVEVLERATSIAALATYIMAAFLIAQAAVAVFRKPKFPALTALAAVLATLSTMLVAPGLSRPLTFGFAMGATAAATATLAVASARTLQNRVTRVPGLLLAGFALDGVLRGLAFALVRSGTLDEAPRSESFARVLGSGSVLVGVVLVLFVHVWLAARGGKLGRYASNVGLLAAVGLCFWMASRHSGPATSMIKHSLSSYEMPPLMTPVLVVGSWRLVLSAGAGLACLLPWRRSSLVLPPLAMLVLGGAAFDMPLANLLTTSAAVWLCFAADDPRTLWVEAAAVGQQRA